MLLCTTLLYALLDPQLLPRFMGCLQLIYLPQMTLMYLTSTAFANENPQSIRIALAVFVFSWAAQFAGHGIFEGRQPALFDSVTQGEYIICVHWIPSILHLLCFVLISGKPTLAFVLAPFFVHLEMLFPFGFNPQLHKDVDNLSAVELARVRKLEGEKKRAKAQ